jgi:putative transposase
VKFAWIQSHKESFDVCCMCQVLAVSRSGFYAWQGRPAGQKATRRQALQTKIRLAHKASRGIYGAPRVAAELAAQGCRVCVNTWPSTCGTRA